MTISTNAKELILKCKKKVVNNKMQICTSLASSLIHHLLFNNDLARVERNKNIKKALNIHLHFFKMTDEVSVSTTNL